MDPLWILVGSIGVKNGWIGNEWLTIIAIALSLSFILASPLNSASHSIFKRWGERLRSLQTKTRLWFCGACLSGHGRCGSFDFGFVIWDFGFRQKKELRALTGHCETQPSKRY